MQAFCCSIDLIKPYLFSVSLIDAVNHSQSHIHLAIQLRNCYMQATSDIMALSLDCIINIPKYVLVIRLYMYTVSKSWVTLHTLMQMVLYIKTAQFLYIHC
jgi:hypothetical protein